MCCFLEARLKIARAGNHGWPPVVFASSPLHVERRVVWSSISIRQLAIAVSTTFEVAQFVQLFFHRNRPNLSSRIGHFCCTASFPVTSLPSMWRGLAPMHASEKPSQQQARLGLLAPLGQLSLQRGAETRIVSRTGDTNSQHDEPAKKNSLLVSECLAALPPPYSPNGLVDRSSTTRREHQKCIGWTCFTPR